jgi:hypothetical protein
LNGLHATLESHSLGKRGAGIGCELRKCIVRNQIGRPIFKVFDDVTAHLSPLVRAPIRRQVRTELFEPCMQSFSRVSRQIGCDPHEWRLDDPNLPAVLGKCNAGKAKSKKHGTEGYGASPGDRPTYQIRK